MSTQTKPKWPLPGPTPAELEIARLQYWRERVDLWALAQEIEDRWEQKLADWYRKEERKEAIQKQKFRCIQGDRRRLE